MKSPLSLGPTFPFLNPLNLIYNHETAPCTFEHPSSHVKVLPFSCAALPAAPPAPPEPPVIDRPVLFLDTPVPPD